MRSSNVSKFNNKSHHKPESEILVKKKTVLKIEKVKKPRRILCTLRKSRIISKSALNKEKSNHKKSSVHRVKPNTKPSRKENDVIESKVVLRKKVSTTPKQKYESTGEDTVAVKEQTLDTGV
jgi:hypothetical protein